MVTGEAMLSFYIARAFWRRGFASEAAAAFIPFGWNELKLSRIAATVQEGNDASVHILQKLGFALTNVDRGARTFLTFALTNPEFDESSC
jgi:ribosomal-protein-alanine N-acetyltransferase